MQRVPPQLEAVATPCRPGQQDLRRRRVHAVTVPTTLAQAPVDVILVARTGTAAGFRIERLNLGAMPRVLGCPWCHVKNCRAIPRPRVTCGECRHFIRDTINPDAGMDRCGAGADPDRPTPMATRECATFRPSG